MAKGENIYKRKDGRWEGRYPKSRKVDGSIHYGYIYARSYRSVKEQLIDKKAQLNVKYYAGESKEFYGTFGHWANLWLTEIVAQKVKESTYASYSNKLSCYILPFLESYPLKKILTSDINKLVEKLTCSLATSSVHIIFRVLKNCFECAKERGYLYLNPCDQVLLPKIEKTKVQALTRNQHKAVEAECQKSEKGLPVLLALETGMRIGEICALKWEDIDFEASVLTVRRTKQRIAIASDSGQRTKMIETAPKTTSSVRIIPLTAKIKAALIRWKRKAQSAYVVSNHQKSLEPRTINYRFEKIKQKLGLCKVPFHALRHTFATRCVELGVNIAAISSLLGHSSIKLTLDTYTNSFIDEQREAVNRLANF